MVRLPENTVLRAGVFMVLAMGSFVTNDTLIKLVGNSLPVGEIIMVRGVIAMAFIGLICAWQGVLGNLPLLRSRYVLLRTTLDLIATILFIMALMHMPIANITAVMQVVPLAVALLSALVLRERIGLGRMVAIVVGFIGVLLIVKPTPANFTIYDVFALLIVLAVAVRDIATRRIPARIPTFLIALANAAFVTAGGAALCAVQGFTMPDAWQLGTARPRRGLPRLRLPVHGHDAAARRPLRDGAIPLFHHALRHRLRHSGLRRISGLACHVGHAADRDHRPLCRAPRRPRQR